MKWPASLTLIRHDTSAYNVLKGVKADDPLYQSFKKAFNKNPWSDASKKLALSVHEKFALNIGDHNTPFAEGAGWQAEEVGKKLSGLIDVPDVVFVSPYLRTQLTLERITKHWPALKKIKIVEEERLREQDHGLSLLYNDWRVFTVLHPEQAHLRKLLTPYWYRYPQGENIPDLRERIRSWLGTLTRDYRGQHVLAVTHHLSIFALRANLERLDADGFIRLDKEEKPINCGVTTYRGEPEKGTDGKLILEQYNRNLYDLQK